MSIIFVKIISRHQNLLCTQSLLWSMMSRKGSKIYQSSLSMQWMMETPHLSHTLLTWSILICIISLGLKVAVAQEYARILNSGLVLLRTEASFHSTQEALFLKQNFLFTSVVHITNVLHLAKIGLDNMVLCTTSRFSKPNRKDGVIRHHIILHPEVLFVNISENFLFIKKPKLDLIMTSTSLMLATIENISAKEGCK